MNMIKNPRPLTQVEDSNGLEKWVILCECSTHYLEVNVDDDDPNWIFVELTDEYHPGHWLLGTFTWWSDLLSPRWWWMHRRDFLKFHKQQEMWRGSRLWTIWRIVCGKPIYFSGVMLNQQSALELSKFLKKRAKIEKRDNVDAEGND